MTYLCLNAQELVDLRLPDLPTSKPALLAKAARENWPSRRRKGRGGGREYPIVALPQAARDALAKKLASAESSIWLNTVLVGLGLPECWAIEPRQFPALATLTARR